jgi:hypothetical protein
MPILDRTVSLPVATCSRSSKEAPCRHCGVAGTHDSAVPSVQILLSRTAALAWRSIFRFRSCSQWLNTVQQELLIDTRCTNVNDITLLDSFGAVDFIDTLCDGETKTTTVLLMSLTISFVEYWQCRLQHYGTLTLHSRMSRRTCS